MIFVADLIACRLNREYCGIYSSNSEAVERALFVAAVDGACCS